MHKDTGQFVYLIAPVSDSVLTQNVAIESQFIFYPNPFTNMVNIDALISGESILNIFDMTGKNLGTWRLNSGLNTINTQSFSSDVYIMQVKTDDGKIIRKKMVKSSWNKIRLSHTVA